MMKTNMLAGTMIAAALAVLLLVAGIATAWAKDPQSQTQRGAKTVTKSPGSERGIIIVGGKGDPSSASTSENILYKYKKKHDKYQVNPGEAVGLNPQPLPPKDMDSKVQLKKNIGEAVGLNPQPLPPKDLSGKVRLKQDLGEAVGLNPQPLPPKDMGGMVR
jgi:hypothetical protein